MTRPKAVIFDLGGVLISSPLKGIQDYETEHGIPHGYLNYAISSASPNAWADLETGRLRTDETFYSRWAEDLSSPKAWEEFHLAKGLKVTKPPPKPHAETLLRRMILSDVGLGLIPETFTALKLLHKNGITTCGLTNNFIIDGDSPFQPLAKISVQLLPYFDYFIESSVIGMRKPHPEIFEHALQKIGCKPEEAVFLDDIGSNLKAAAKLGIRCIRVRIGKEGEAIAELEKIMNMKLRDEKARL